MNTTTTNQQDLTLLKEKFVLEVTQILNAQQLLEEEHKKLVEAVKQSKQATDSRDITVKHEDIMDITRISDDLYRREHNLQKQTRKLFHSVSPSNIFVSQEFFDAWIEISETMSVRFDYESDRIVVRQATPRI